MDPLKTSVLEVALNSAIISNKNDRLSNVILLLKASINQSYL